MNYSYAIQQRRQAIAFTRILSSYGCAGEGEALCGKCGPCEARLWLDENDLTKPPTHRTLNDRETEVFNEFPMDWTHYEEWLRPMDLGGRNGSDHSAVLMRLVQKGYVEMKPWGGHCRGSWRYRPISRAHPQDR